MREEKVHGGVQVGIEADDQHHAYIPQHSAQVDQQKQHREDQLQLRRLCQPRKDEVRHVCIISSTHGVCPLVLNS